MRRPNLFPAFAPILALFAGACSDPAPDTGPDPRNQVMVTIEAIGQSDGTTRVIACSSRPVNSNCALEGQIVASSAGQEVELAYGLDDGERRHHGDLDGAEEDKEIVVSYRNEEAGIDAPSSRVLLPQPFTITSPAADAPLVIGEEARITWEPSGGPAPMEWVYEATCTGDAPGIFGDSGVIEDDPGELTLGPEVLRLREGDVCTLEIRIIRYRYGDLDPAIPDGVILGEQIRAATLTVGP
ncbi:MAG TPA: hypothetical protein VLS89_07830 [Candidatus Nanopelagicales bacterium]|nr:hypothetical protein [Candidatus Nanopelagicales bacterium]